MVHLVPAAGAPAPTQTAVIAPVPAAEPLVGEQCRTALDSAVGSVGAFDCRFARTEWFGNDVLWLDPEPAEPLRRLTAAVGAAFPQHPPYGGIHDAVVPHLTVAERRLADLPALRATERAVRLGLPLSTRLDRVLLIAGAPAPSSWRIVHEIPLGTVSRARDR